MNSNTSAANEFIFVVDCSGSMEDENKIGLVRDAVTHLFRELPNDCHTNIIQFGTNYYYPFNRPENIGEYWVHNRIHEFVENMEANMGGTELVSYAIFNFPCTITTYLFLLHS